MNCFTMIWVEVKDMRLNILLYASPFNSKTVGYVNEHALFLNTTIFRLSTIFRCFGFSEVSR